jgi:hypothetical protein
MLGIGDRKTLINRGLKNPNRYKHASQVRDGLNTVRDFEVAHTKDLKRPKSHFFKRPKKRGKFTLKIGVQKGSKIGVQNSKNTVNQGPLGAAP